MHARPLGMLHKAGQPLCKTGPIHEKAGAGLRAAGLVNSVEELFLSQAGTQRLSRACPASAVKLLLSHTGTQTACVPACDRTGPHNTGRASPAEQSTESLAAMVSADCLWQGALQVSQLRCGAPDVLVSSCGSTAQEGSQAACVPASQLHWGADSSLPRAPWPVVLLCTGH